MNKENTMKAARFYKVNEPLQIDSVSIPSIKEDEVLIKVRAVGLCGSDVSIVYGGYINTSYQPITLGHEASGIVVETGAQVKEWKTGDRVSMTSIVSCNSCPNCLDHNEDLCTKPTLIGVHHDGALAEYLAVPAKNLVRLPDNVSFPIGAIITDAVATPYHALINRASLKEGETLAIYGAGGLGMHAIQIAKMIGVKKIFVVDVREEQLERAKQLGADVTINAKLESPVKRIKQETNGQGVDVAAEFVGNKTTYDQTVDSIKWGGRAVFVGIGPDPLTVGSLKLIQKQISLHGSWGFPKETIETLVEVVSNNRLQLEDSITHTFNLDQANTALEYLHKKIENPIRIIITLPE